MKALHPLSRVALCLLVSRVAADICSQVTPSRHIPSGMKCYFEGSVSSLPGLGNITIPHPASERALATCRNTCLEDPDCTFYGFNTKSGVCSRYTVSSSLRTAKAGNTNTFLTNRYCWQQNFTTSAGLQNVGFETGGLSLTPWFRTSNNSQYLPRQTKPGANESTYSALLSVGSRIGTYTQSIYLPFDLCPNVTYQIQPLVQFLGPENTNSTSLISFSMANAVAGNNAACAASASSANAFNSSSDFVLYSPYAFDGYLNITNGNQASAFGIGFGLHYDAEDFSGNPNPLSPPFFEQYRVDFNIRKTMTEVDYEYGTSCSAES